MDWRQGLIGVLGLPVFWWGVRYLDGTVTRVRARFGLGAAWGAAILGFAAIFGGMGAIALIVFMVLEAST